MKIPKASLMILTLTLVFSAYAFASPGADLYKSKGCAACHGATGAGDTTMGKNLKLRDLGSADVQKQSDDELATIIGKGKGKMPSYENKLTKEQVSDVVKFIRSLKK